MTGGKEGGREEAPKVEKEGEGSKKGRSKSGMGRIERVSK